MVNTAITPKEVAEAKSAELFARCHEIKTRNGWSVRKLITLLGISGTAYHRMVKEQRGPSDWHTVLCMMSIVQAHSKNPPPPAD